MANVARVGRDSAEGLIIGVLAPNIKINGSPVALVGASVAGHGPLVHESPVMASGSRIVSVNGIPLCRKGDSASCGHTATSGSPNVRVHQ